MMLEKNQVVQLNPTTIRNKAFAGCLAVVSEVKDFGAQVYVQGLGTREEMGGQAYYRATWEEMSPLLDDKAQWVIE